MDQFAFTQCNAAAFGVRQEIRVGACFVFLCAFFSLPLASDVFVTHSTAKNAKIHKI